MMAGCNTPVDTAEENAVYYWRTDLRMDSTERDFVERYHIKKVYCRYFDVVMNNAEEGPVPNATITFTDQLPEGVEMVPTVYLTENCMHQWHEGLAEKLVKRIRQMNETHDIGGVREIQIDCDYTLNSRMNYYRFLEEVKKAWGGRLSTTIRLHQLSMQEPPADYGVLMVYNTGDPQKADERNPILDIRDVRPYLKYLADYALPMAAAYPVYCWLRTVHGVHITHTVEASEILLAKKEIERKRPAMAHGIVTYHLDKDNIDRYSKETYEKIYLH